MKKTFRLLGLALVAVLFTTLCSCSSDDEVVPAYQPGKNMMSYNGTEFNLEQAELHMWELTSDNVCFTLYTTKGKSISVYLDRSQLNKVLDLSVVDKDYKDGKISNTAIVDASDSDFDSYYEGNKPDWEYVNTCAEEHLAQKGTMLVKEIVKNMEYEISIDYMKNKSTLGSFEDRTFKLYYKGEVSQYYPRNIDDGNRNLSISEASYDAAALEKENCYSIDLKTHAGSIHIDVSAKHLGEEVWLDKVDPIEDCPYRVQATADMGYGGNEFLYGGKMGSFAKEDNVSLLLVKKMEDGYFVIRLVYYMKAGGYLDIEYYGPLTPAYG